MADILIKNPSNGQRAWFKLPLYFGQLSRIGHSCSYDDEVEILKINGNVLLSEGRATLYDLDEANRLLERID
ncbi:TPA: hypothetical protein U2D46_001235 [Streptococcus suis]|uniref:Uncharacterized protein n=1 Tax=Streptococcus suis TaxID=1307 RepID=A0AAW9DIX3_STRSU|nr:hypothetical protein [Streptococcus suis]AUC92717.1 hypothetical protein CWM22_12860 [Streptococcus suis]MCK3891221.1 hypothetical protein [Streptococcus suis]MDW8713224.1 hypothetical protein [Streptococcus suis]MDX4991561.1 hypothetical protein [Streptococcus suis]MDX5038873.1 hypothetical protein [Streptococcus suis]